MQYVSLGTGEVEERCVAMDTEKEPQISLSVFYRK